MVEGLVVCEGVVTVSPQTELAVSRVVCQEISARCPSLSRLLPAFLPAGQYRPALTPSLSTESHHQIITDGIKLTI